MQFDERLIGIEAEYLTLNEEGEVVVPPSYVDRDDFPLLAEIRAKPGKTVADTVSNFLLRKMEVEGSLPRDRSMSIQSGARVGLDVYREALRACTKPKNETLSQAKSIYGTDVTDFSDQIIKNGKIQGINISCGLHIHFSCRAVDRVEVRTPKYTAVQIPIRVPETVPEGAKTLLQPYLDLYKCEDYEVESVLEATASLLNQPTVEWMVRSLDEAFFDLFAPDKKERTKYRQPGFYERKEYGFEYRSLPASPESLDALPEIMKVAFDLLCTASENA